MNNKYEEEATTNKVAPPNKQTYYAHIYYEQPICNSINIATII